MRRRTAPETPTADAVEEHSRPVLSASPPTTASLRCPARRRAWMARLVALVVVLSTVGGLLQTVGVETSSAAPPATNPDLEGFSGVVQLGIKGDPIRFCPGQKVLRGNAKDPNAAPVCGDGRYVRNIHSIFGRYDNPDGSFNLLTVEGKWLRYADGVVSQSGMNRSEAASFRLSEPVVAPTDPLALLAHYVYGLSGTQCLSLTNGMALDVQNERLVPTGPQCGATRARTRTSGLNPGLDELGYLFTKPENRPAPAAQGARGDANQDGINYIQGLRISDLGLHINIDHVLDIAKDNFLVAYDEQKATFTLNDLMRTFVTQLTALIPRVGEFLSEGADVAFTLVTEGAPSPSGFVSGSEPGLIGSRTNSVLTSAADLGKQIKDHFAVQNGELDALQGIMTKDTMNGDLRRAKIMKHLTEVTGYAQKLTDLAGRIESAWTKTIYRSMMQARGLVEPVQGDTRLPCYNDGDYPKSKPFADLNRYFSDETVRNNRVFAVTSIYGYWTSYCPLNQAWTLRLDNNVYDANGKVVKKVGSAPLPDATFNMLFQTAGDGLGLTTREVACDWGLPRNDRDLNDYNSITGTDLICSQDQANWQVHGIPFERVLWAPNPKDVGLNGVRPNMVINTMPNIDPGACKSIPSSYSSTKVRVLFANGTTETLNIEWVDWSGQRIKYATLKPGEAYSQDTYVGHNWRVTQSVRAATATTPALDRCVGTYHSNGMQDPTAITAFDGTIVTAASLTSLGSLVNP